MKWLEGIDRTPRPTADFLVEINQRLQRDIGYTVRMQPGVQSCEETLNERIGSCRDFAWLLVQILRHLGFAARFVSGYLVQLTADLKALDGPSGPDADFTDLHAWAETYVPGAGWVGLDATSGLFAGEGHIPLACTPEPASAAPVTGETDPCELQFYFHNRVTRIHEDPRVTKPFTEAQWESILALGDAVDQKLDDDDVRLTMGGEPTFVSIDDMDGAQWNTAAFGDDKRRLSGELLLRLKEQFARGALLHYGQGKWYPGEPPPRWALSCFWRGDGTPVWRDARLLADELHDYAYGVDDAKRFITSLAEHLRVDADCVTPGYEDVYYTLWHEGSLPDNVDPFAADLESDLERKRLLAQLQGGLDEITGFALPLGRASAAFPGAAWRTSRWHFRRDRMYLVPGDSPMGLRLPLGALPWVDPELREPDSEADPFELRAPLGDVRAGVASRFELGDNNPGEVAPPSGSRHQRHGALQSRALPGNIAHGALCGAEKRKNLRLPAAGL